MTAKSIAQEIKIRIGLVMSLMMFTFGLLLTTWADDYRVFTDNQGRIIKVKIIKVDKKTKKVTLERENKKKATVSISIFSETDQEYINTWSATPRPDESLEPKTTPTNLSINEVKQIARQYLDWIKKEDYLIGANRFYLRSIDIKSQVVRDAFRDYYSTTKFNEIEKARLVRNTGDYFLMEVTVLHTYSNGEKRRTGPLQVRALLTAEGKIKYETIIQPHPVEELTYLLSTYVEIRNWKERWMNSYPRRHYPTDNVGVNSKPDQVLNGRKLRFITLLKECGYPSFGVDTGPSYTNRLNGDEKDEMEEALEDVIDWLLENGTRIDVSSPKVFIPKKAFKDTKDMLKDIKDAL